jgi:hypothetical protein
MTYVNPEHAGLVAEYERLQAETDATWPGRPEAPWRIRTFLVPADSSD